MANTTTDIRHDWCVIYRSGGTERFQWHRTQAMTAAQAADTRGEVARMGYAAKVVNYRQSVAIGLPETYE